MRRQATIIDRALKVQLSLKNIDVGVIKCLDRLAEAVDRQFVKRDALVLRVEIDIETGSRLQSLVTGDLLHGAIGQASLGTRDVDLRLS